MPPGAPRDGDADERFVLSDDDSIRWHRCYGASRQVEVLRAANGAPRLEFHGHAHELALSLGVSSALLSLSHSSQWAVAQVLLQGEAAS